MAWDSKFRDLEQRLTKVTADRDLWQDRCLDQIAKVRELERLLADERGVIVAITKRESKKEWDRLLVVHGLKGRPS